MEQQKENKLTRAFLRRSLLNEIKLSFHLKRGVGNWAKNLNIDIDEATEFAKKILHEMVDEALSL